MTDWGQRLSRVGYKKTAGDRPVEPADKDITGEAHPAPVLQTAVS